VEAEAGRFEIQVFCKFTNSCEFQAEPVAILAWSESRTKFGHPIPLASAISLPVTSLTLPL
jgi:hypothetical protein